MLHTGARCRGMICFFARNWQVLQGISVSWEVSWVIIGSNWLSQQLKHPLPTAEWHSKRRPICSDLWKHQRSHFQHGSYSLVSSSSAGLGPSPAQLIGDSFLKKKSLLPIRSAVPADLQKKGWTGEGRTPICQWHLPRLVSHPVSWGC